jgi:hypothetical protein
MHQVDCGITLKPEPSSADQHSEPTEEKLQSFRRYISALRLAEYKFSEDMAKVNYEREYRPKSGRTGGRLHESKADFSLSSSLCFLCPVLLCLLMAVGCQSGLAAIFFLPVFLYRRDQQPNLIFFWSLFSRAFFSL